MNPYKSLGATVDPHRARSKKKALSMPSPTDRNLTALPTENVKLPARRQARHFTMLDQVTQLVAARDADPELGFMVRLLALCSLPRTNPGDQHEFRRVNGPYTLYMTAGAGSSAPLPVW